jgi:DNA-binding NtrC family response regulator
MVLNKRNVLVLDQQGGVSRQLRQLACADLVFHLTDSVAAAKHLVLQKRCRVGLVVFDHPPHLGQEEIEPLISAVSATEWLAVVTPELLQEPAFQAFVLRAFHDYHTLPLDAERLLATLGHAYGKAHLRVALNEKSDESGRFGMYGASAPMRAFFRQLEKVLRADLPVLIGGETGTGKELVAQAIHKHSKRSSGPFVVVNCGAIPTGLIQSELFGHERGAFTGALQRKVGSIEAAHGGVLFLDEIGDLPLSLQANLLRVLQERVITRLGSTQAIQVDFRIIAATHVDLREAIRFGRFREDLYYRLNVVSLHLPPLCEREGDIALLGEAVFRKFAQTNRHCQVKGFSLEALRAMNAYHWPGNVRELINRVHRAVIMSENRLISAADLGLEPYANDQQILTLEDARASVERDVVETSLRANGNNVSQAARQLGVSRVTLYRMMNKLNIAPVQ